MDQEGGFPILMWISEISKNNQNWYTMHLHLLQFLELASIFQKISKHTKKYQIA